MSGAWIFQGNPNRFNIEAFIAAAPLSATWLVNRYSSQMQVGDRVFLWMSGGGIADRAGVFASGRITSPVFERADEGPLEWWSDPSEALKPASRVRIEMDRFVGGPKDVIRRKWLADDPHFKQHPIITLQTGTNFKLDGQALERLSRLWSRSNAPWTYEDTIAGLHAFAQTRGGPLSKIPGAIIVDMALLTGRAIQGMYNKVLNFRAMDPEDPRAGLDAKTLQDTAAWAKFYDPATGLNVVGIQAEFDRLFTGGGEIDAAAEAEAVAETADRLAREQTLDDLMRTWAGRSSTDGKPRAGSTRSRYYARDALVAAIARKRAVWSCEVQGCPVPIFEDAKGRRFVEVHHLDRLADDGPDIPENVICVCAHHHRELHYGKRRADLTAELKALRLATP